MDMVVMETLIDLWVHMLCDGFVGVQLCDLLYGYCICMLSCYRLVVYIWRTVMPLKGWRCGGKAARDPIYKHQRPFKSSIVRSIYTWCCWCLSTINVVQVQLGTM